jgi:hypothetical protein
MLVILKYCQTNVLRERFVALVDLWGIARTYDDSLTAIPVTRLHLPFRSDRLPGELVARIQEAVSKLIASTPLAQDLSDVVSEPRGRLPVVERARRAA